jgi:glucoamylase
MIAVAALVAASLSGASEQPPEPISTRLPDASIPSGVRPLGPGAPPWARGLYRCSVRVLVALTDRNGAMIAGEREGWDYVWPRDAAVGAMALEAAGLHAEARRVVGFLSGQDLDDAARFYSDGSGVPGRPPAGDREGWVEAAARAVERGLPATVLPKVPMRYRGQDGSDDWRDRQDYGENVAGDLLGNAIAGGALPDEIRGHFLGARGLTREEGGNELDSSAAWAVTVFPSQGLRGVVKGTLLEMTRESAPYGIPPIEGWTPGEVWTAPTAWSAWALIELGERRAADRLLAELRRAATPLWTLPERVDATDGRPTSTTPLAWSHAFAILALRARYPDR